MAPISVGAVLSGRYRVTARLGAGGMATIYRAVDESLERDVAIKVLHPHLADDESLLKRFRAEARAAAGLLHPNIVNVFDQGVAGLPFIVMEYVDGPSLRDVLTQRGRLTPAEVLAIAEPVGRALARAHSAGVIHRDVKPENVLIAADGTPKIADFGIARAIAETSHTATGTLVGSVHYMPPELMGGVEASARSDQYSFGVMLFELLTGRKPLHAETPMAIAMRHTKERIPSVREFVHDAPAALDGVIARATAAKPDKRYPDMQALVAALDHAVPGGPQPVVITGHDHAPGEHTLIIPVEAETTVTVERPDKRRRRGRSRAMVGGPRRRRRSLAVWALALVLVLAAGGASAWNWVIAPVQDVPQLMGLTEAAAAEVLAEQGLQLLVVGTAHDVDIPEGQVLRQDPGSDAAARRGTTVTVTLSAGPDDVELPDAVGQPASDMAEQLAGPPFHLEVEIVRVFHDTVGRGEVIRQRPAAGKVVQQGSTVTLRVSRGIEQVEVPDLSGATRAEAIMALEGVGLLGDFTEEYSDEVPEPGAVISQEIDAGTTVDKGTTVAVVVSKGPVTFAIDSYVGQGLEQARTALRGLDLQVRVTEQARPRIGPFPRGEYGRVEAQVPEPGTKVKRGDTVHLYTFSAAADEREYG
jgi:eukaryotic-like serine/threonine-protein kinase